MPINIEVVLCGSVSIYLKCIYKLEGRVCENFSCTHIVLISIQTTNWKFNNIAGSRLTEKYITTIKSSMLLIICVIIYQYYEYMYRSISLK